MSYFSYITPECEREAKNFNSLSNVQKHAGIIEEQQSIELLEPIGIFKQKVIGNSVRLFIAQIDDQQDHLMVFFAVVHKDTDYCKNLQKNHALHESIYNSVISSVDVKKIFSEKRASPQIPKIPDLDEKEREYLYTQFENPDSCLILESDEWVNRTKGKFSPRLGELFDLVCEIATNNNEETEIFDSNGLGIICKKSLDERMIYLIAPVLKSDPQDIQNLNNKFHTELGDTVTRELILKRSKRAYPDIILGKQDLWIHSVEAADENANLALSDEEAKLLRSQPSLYPLFINGRPGSGKSTILQYLFAEHTFPLIAQNFDIGYPLYLTYNNDLLEIARKNVFYILTSNAEKLSRQDQVSEKKAEEYLEKCFVNFRDFLLTVIQDKKHFDESKYVDFSEYKRLHEDYFKKNPVDRIRNISPELAWHIIRTYIKGALVESDSYLDPDSFSDLPEKQKSVAQDKFDEVFTYIWKPWYKNLCENEGYWDDQDLTRALLGPDVDLNSYSKHPVVFCDEAQDFSKNELRLIYRLSLFSNRNLDSEDLLVRIPFAFAGDPFQTINPTGFDWSSTQTGFYQTIISQIDKTRNPNLSMNYQELAFNYRSTASIVQLCNFIHLIRGIVFKKKDLIPQTAYFDEEANMPGYFDISSPVFQTQLTHQEETVIIVPCQEGGELDYVINDDFLKSFALNDDHTQITRNILSAMRAKGQGFKRVVIYKFGQECIKEYPKLLELIDLGVNHEDLLHEEAIPLEYFINRLYVAASRAMNRLIIADTKEGVTKFWKFFRDIPLTDYVESYMKLVKYDITKGEFSWNKESIVKIQEGSSKDWDEEGRDDPAQLGEIFFQKSGRTDPYLLERAARNFKLAGLNDKAIECEAWQYKANGEYQKSGERFEKLYQYGNALRMYWKAGAYRNITQLQGLSLEKDASIFMLNSDNKKTSDCFALLEKLLDGVKDEHLYPDETWKKVLVKIINQFISAAIKEKAASPQWREFLRLTNEAQNTGLAHELDLRLLNDLRLHSADYPEQLSILQDISADPKMILDTYLRNINVPIDDVQQGIVFSSLRREGKEQQILDFLNKYPDTSRIGLQLSDALRNYKKGNIGTEKIEDLTSILIKFLVNQGKWDIVLDFVNKKKLSTEKPTQDEISYFSWGYLLDRQFIKILSNSDTLVKAELSFRKDISKYLRSHLIDNSSEFYNDLTVKQAGVALERANMITDGLKFYENIFEAKTWPATDEEIEYAKVRWLVCKKRQLSISNESAQKRRKQEISQRLKEWHIENIPPTDKYPEVNIDEKPKPLQLQPRKKLPLVDDIIKKQPPTEPVFGIGPVDPPNSGKPTLKPTRETTGSSDEPYELKCKIDDSIVHCSIHRGNKMTIRFEDYQEMVTILPKKFKLSGSDDEFQDEIEELEKSDDLIKYFIRPWQLTCILRYEEDSMFVDLQYGETNCDLVTIRAN